MNNLMQITNLMRQGRSFNGIMQQMARSDPRVNQFVGMVNGKSTSQLRQMAENIARERGLDLNEVARSMGITVPSER